MSAPHQRGFRGPTEELPPGHTFPTDYTPHRFEQVREEGWKAWSQYMNAPEEHFQGKHDH